MPTAQMRLPGQKTPPAQDGGGGGGDDSNKYLLRVTAGPSYDATTHSLVPVNADSQPAPLFSNDHLAASVRVRVRGYNGLPSGSPASSPYFEQDSRAKDQYSVSFAFVPKRDIPARDLVWGNDFDHPIRDRLPPGFNTAFRIVKEFIDPGLSCDAYADQPWLYGPALSSWFALRVGERVEGRDVEKVLKAGPGGRGGTVAEGADGSGREVRQKLGLPEGAQKRRKWGLDERNRAGMVFEAGRLYEGDFYNPYLDFGKFALKLPGFSLGVLKYINDKTHHLRYVCKDRASGEVLFCVVFTLLYGDEVTAALEEEKGAKEQDEDLD